MSGFPPWARFQRGKRFKRLRIVPFQVYHDELLRFKNPDIPHDVPNTVWTFDFFEHQSFFGANDLPAMTQISIPDHHLKFSADW